MTNFASVQNHTTDSFGIVLLGGGVV